MIAALLTALAATGTADATVIVDLAEGRLKVQESWMIRLEEAAPAGDLSIPLPAGAKAITQPAEQEGFIHDAASGRLVNRSRIAGGRTHIFFNYDLPYGSPNVTFRRNRPTVNVSGLRLAVPRLDGLGVRTPKPGNRSLRDLRGVPFELIDLLQPFPGATLSIDLSGLPVRPEWPRWFAVVLCGVLLVATAYLLVIARQRGVAAADRPELLARKERLVQALELLDRDRPGLDEAAYAKRRSQLVDQLADVLRQEAR